jgi:hypothetical protein
MPSPYRRVLAGLLACTVSLLPLTGTAHAAMVPTHDAASPVDGVRIVLRQGSAAPRAQFATPPGRPALATRLVALGLSPAEAASRVATLDDATAGDAAVHLEQIPAGAGALGIAAFAIGVLVLTEALGITRIIPILRGR